MIEKDEVPSYKIFTNEPEKKRKRRHAKENREAVEAEKNQKEFEKGILILISIREHLVLGK